MTCKIFLDMTNKVLISHDHHFVHEQAIAAEAIKPQASASAAASASHVQPALAFSQQPSATATSTATPTSNNNGKDMHFGNLGPGRTGSCPAPEGEGTRNWTSTTANRGCFSN
jgi:hypothetical protein